MFYGTVHTLDSTDDSVTLQAVEITDGRVIIRLRDSLLAPGPHDTSGAAAVGPEWTLEDAHGNHYAYEQASSGGGPFQGLVDIAFTVGEAFDRAGELRLDSPGRSIRFSLQTPP